MKARACLVAGPLSLDDLPEAPDTLGGSGFYAAAAAAPFALSQLWARAGDLGPHLRRIISARHIDQAGLSYEGPIRHWSPQQGCQDPVLPDLQPVRSQDLACVLLIDLPGKEMDRAVAALQGMGESSYPLLIAPQLAHCQEDPDLLNRCCRSATLLCLDCDSAQALTGYDDPLSAALDLQQRGAKSVALSAGSLGGLLCYQQKRCTWPAYPLPLRDHRGVRAALWGSLCGALAEAQSCDWRSLKRGLALSSGVASICGQGIGPKKLLSANRSDYQDRFTALRRNSKF